MVIEKLELLIEYHEKIRGKWQKHGLIKSGFVTCMGPLTKEVEVVAIHKNSCSTIFGKERLEAFRIFSEAVTEKYNWNANIKYAWFGSSKEEIGRIISHGFSRTTEPKSGECFSIGVYLYPANFDGLLSAVEDENGSQTFYWRTSHVLRSCT